MNAAAGGMQPPPGWELGMRQLQVWPCKPDAHLIKAIWETLRSYEDRHASLVTAEECMT